MPIIVLPPEVASLIAAGEVVGRPADAAKELLENAIDAIALRVVPDAPTLPWGRVHLEVGGGGAQLLRITDDGCGIPEGELEIAFQRHATSKIGSAQDLTSVTTLGFRGEALPSIAAVAQVQVITRTASEEVGSYLALAGGEVSERGRRPWGQGTSITVRNLFYNVPARRRFLRSTGAETGHIAHLVSQYTLAYPEIQFVLEIDGRRSFRSPGSGRLEDAIAAVYGPEALRQMARMDPAVLGPGPEEPAVRVRGYTGQPSLTHANRSHISLFVNRRWVQNRALVFAVSEAYRDLLPPGRHPVAVLDLEVNPRDVDVNVHPAKAEVRFARERQAFADVQRAVRAALAVTVVPREFASRADPPPPMADVPAHQPQFAFQLPDRSDAVSPMPPGQAASPEPVGGRRLPILRVIGQVGGAFIVAEGPTGLYLIDQHRAHERVLHDRLRRESAEGGTGSQLLLDPLTLELTPRQAALVEDRLAELAALGLRLEPFGERAYLVRAVPAFLKAVDLAGAIVGLFDELVGENSRVEWRERAIVALACRGAVKAGHVLSLEEMRQLIVQLEASPLPQTCPHGAPTMVHLSQAQLEREFFRR